MALVLVLGCAGCAPWPILPERTASLPTATLPLASAGIADVRPAFAALFFDELRSGKGDAPAELSEWLHDIPFASGDYERDLPALRERFAQRAGSTSVLIVPGLFGDCVESQSVPFGDGVLRTPQRSRTEAYQQYADLGLLGIRSIALPGRSSSVSNGMTLAREIRRESQRAGVRRILIVAYSKGAPDTLHALAQLQTHGGIPPQLKALVSVAGASMGTPIADHAEHLYEAFSPWFQPFDCAPSDGHELSSLTRRERVAWLTAHPLPPGLSYFSIIAHAAQAEVSRALQTMHAALAAFDVRNDGQLLASDMLLPRSTLLAEARADHWDVALPRERHPNPVWRALGSGRSFPREALFRATIKWVVGSGS